MTKLKENRFGPLNYIGNFIILFIYRFQYYLHGHDQVQVDIAMGSIQCNGNALKDIQMIFMRRWNILSI